MTIGVFGGSFNPIHNGHVALGRELVKGKYVDELWYMVSPQNPLKRDADMLDEDFRLELVRLALQNDEHLVACDFEFRLPRPSYTVLTLEALREKYPLDEFVLVIGADNWSRFSEWYRGDEILRHHRVLVYRRTGYEVTDVHAGVEVVETNRYDISSTMVREAMRRDDYDGEGLPRLVWNRLKHFRTS